MEARTMKRRYRQEGIRVMSADRGAALATRVISPFPVLDWESHYIHWKGENYA